MAGVAGLLYDVRIQTLTYSVGFLLGLKAFTAAVLGGIGNLRGALLGGLLLGVVENYARRPVRQPVEGLRRLRRAGGAADVPADRSAGRIAGKGTGMTTTVNPPTPEQQQAIRTAQHGREAVGSGGTTPRAGCAGRRWSALIAFFYALPNREFYQYLGPIPTHGLRLHPGAVHRLDLRAAGASGLNVVVGFAGLLDLGYFGFFAVGAYTVAVLTSPSSDLKTLWPWLLVVPIAIAMTMLSGVMLGYADAAAARRLPGDRDARLRRDDPDRARSAPSSSRASGASTRSRTRPASTPTASRSSACSTPRPYYWLVLTLIILVVIGVRNLTHSRVGRAWISIREDEDAAAADGRADVQVQALGVRLGRGDRRPGRRALRRQAELRQLAELRAAQLDPHPGRRSSSAARATSSARSSAAAWWRT